MKQILIKLLVISNVSNTTDLLKPNVSANVSENQIYKIIKTIGKYVVIFIINGGVFYVGIKYLIKKNTISNPKDLSKTCEKIIEKSNELINNITNPEEIKFFQDIKNKATAVKEKIKNEDLKDALCALTSVKMELRLSLNNLKHHSDVQNNQRKKIYIKQDGDTEYSSIYINNDQDFINQKSIDIFELLILCENFYFKLLNK